MRKLIEDFLVYLNFNKGLATSSQKNYQSDLNLFYTFLEKSNIKHTTHNAITAYINELHKKKYSDKSIARKISSIKSFFDFLIHENIIQTNPTALLKRPKQTYKLPSVLSLHEVELLINSTPEEKTNHLTIRNTAIIELLYSCGLRVSELVNLVEKNISYDEKTIKVIGKGHKERILPFGKKAYQKLLDYTNNVRPKINKKLSSNFFLGKNGTTLSRQHIWSIINKKMLQCNISKKTSPHTLRHSFATHLLNNNAPIHIIQKLLGHQNISATEIYTHLSTKNLHKTYIKLHPRAKSLAPRESFHNLE